MVKAKQNKKLILNILEGNRICEITTEEQQQQHKNQRKTQNNYVKSHKI